MKRLVLLLLLVCVSGARPQAAPQGAKRNAKAVGTKAPKPEPVRVDGNVEAMAANYSMTVYGDDPVKLKAAVDQAADEVRRIDHLISNYKPASDWSQINELAGKQPVRVSEEAFRLIQACVDYSRQSEGTFDITVGPLMKIWGFYKGTGHLPHRAEVRGALARVGYQKLILDPKTNSVRFAVEGMNIDPGGIGKGYAVDRMVDILKENGVQSALVSGGGSSIYALGTPPGEPGWTVTIRHPRDASKVVESVVLKNQSMSTSGNYEKFFYAEGKIYSHIMDPRTGFPAEGMLSVSVVTPRTIDSEAWAKPYYILGRKWAAQHKPKDFRVYTCEDRTELACAWLP